MRAHSKDDGFSLVEVIVALFLFAVISLAVLPLLISGVSLSAVNRDVVAATSVANDRIAQVRELFPTSTTSMKTCADLLTTIAALPETDPGNPAFDIATQARPETVPPGNPVPPICPAGDANYPRAVLVTVTVTDGADATTVPTRITVGAEK